MDTTRFTDSSLRELEHLLGALADVHLKLIKIDDASQKVEHLKDDHDLRGYIALHEANRHLEWSVKALIEHIAFLHTKIKVPSMARE